MSHDTEAGHPPLRDGSAPQAVPLGPRARWKDPDEPPGLWDDKRNVERLLRGFYVVCTLVLLLDLVIHRHLYHPWERLFGFHAWYGFIAGWNIVVIAKHLRRFLMKSEDYYDRD